MRLLKNLFLGFVFTTGVGLVACHHKSDKTNSSADSIVTTAPAPVQIETDDVLKTGTRDATKDYPGVTASVNNGEITLTGEITRDRLQKLMQALNTLHPKKINNNLTIK